MAVRVVVKLLETLYWHDYETWGAVPSRDRPSQFAGIRTDLDFNPIGDPLNIFAKPSNDYLPHPEACLVTGLSPQHAYQHGVNEAQFMAQIHRELAQAGTCSVGYNSLRFDEEITRFGLWRNFYEPYAREWQNGNSRWDIIDMVRATYLMRPEGIEWPTHDTGAPSFKLEHLTEANGIGHESAHDALSDVWATIALGKLIKTQQPKLYDYLFQLRHKRSVLALFDWETYKPLLHVSSRFSAEQGCGALVMPLAKHPVNKNAMIMVNLASDPEPLLTLPADILAEKLYTPSSELAENEERIPLKLVHANRCPVLVTAKMAEQDRVQQLIQLDLNQAREHWRVWRDAVRDPAFVEKLQAIYSAAPPSSASKPAEQSLYDGFIPQGDKALMAQLQQATPDQLRDFPAKFQDARLQGMVLGYKARNFPETLTDRERLLWEERRLQQLMEPSDGGLSLDDFHELLFTLQETRELTMDQQKLLADLSDFADAII